MTSRLFVLLITLVHISLGNAATTPALVPATFQPITDSFGFSWDIDQSGSIGNGSNCFSNALYLEINGSGLSFQQPMMTPDGSEYFFNTNYNQLDVSRRVKVDSKAGFVRYFDSVRNNGSAPQNVRIQLRIQFNNQMQGTITDSGTALSGNFGAKDSGIVVLRPAGQQGPSALFLLAGRGAKTRPTVQNQQNYRVNLSYSIPLAPGETVSLAYAAAQRNLAGTPDAKALAKLFAPLNSPRLLADVPVRDRKTLANFAPGSFSSGPSVPALASMLDILNVERGPTDQLVIGADTRLKGTASCSQLEIETSLGKATVPFENVAAILGGRREMRVVLRDGQALTGRALAKDLKFALSTGTTINLDVAKLDRLVMRALPGDTQAAAAAWGLVESFNGDRLAVKADPALRLRASTAWGAREIAPEDLLGFGPTEENPLGFRVLLKDGSQFIGFFDGESMAFDTILFGKKTLLTSEIRQIAVAQPKPAVDSADTPPEIARVILAGGQVLSGQIDLPELHFLSQAGVIPVASNLIRTLHNTDEGGGESRPIFTATVWGGGSIAGTLRETVVPVRSGNHVFQVPVRDVVDAMVPSPAMPEGLRDKISVLIRDLGHADWEKREAASRELGELGSVARAPLNEVVKQSKDAEVLRRAQALIDSIETL